MEFLYLVGLATPAAVIAIIVLACNLSACKKESQMWENKYRRLVGSPLRGTNEIKKGSEGSLNLSDEARDRIQKEIAFNMKMSDANKRSQEIRKKEQDLFLLEKKLKNQEDTLDNRIRSYKEENESLKKSIRDLQSKISSLEWDKRNLDITISVHQDTEKKLRNEISELRELKSAREIDELRLQLRRSNSSEEKLKEQLAEKNAIIKRLDDHLTFYKNESEQASQRYSQEISALSSQVSDGESADYLFLKALERLENGSEKFYRYPTILDFYERVKDKRFHRALTEDIEFMGRIAVSATIVSDSHKIYETSLTRCNCTDYGRTSQPCKHMMFLAYHSGVLSVRKDLLEQSMKIYFDKLRTTPVPKK